VLIEVNAKNIRRWVTLLIHHAHRLGIRPPSRYLVVNMTRIVAFPHPISFNITGSTRGIQIVIRTSIEQQGKLQSSGTRHLKQT
jgi:hypothetical protein